MTGEKVSFEEAAKQTSDARHNDRSSIVFPYLDLDTAVSVAKEVYARAAFSDCALDELAAQVGQTVSGAFRLKVATAKTFGFLERSDRGSFRLSELGRRVVTPETELDARATAFLNIPLYRAIYERYRGRLLPPAKALEREMGQLGVAPKQTDKARQTFERAAKQSHFFAEGIDRLVQPRIRDASTLPPPMTAETIESLATKQGSGGPPRQPLEYQLIDLLKRPGIGDAERDAIWTLVQFLAGKPEPEAA
ncbi:MAG TPA: hypothetical protein VGU20_20740 [Stellaceae bacterium]|nr:hypothetical protein [Stellaceae bacterium]